MLTWLWDFLFHRHIWETLERTRTHIYEYESDTRPVYHMVSIHQKCTICNKYKIVKLKE